MAEPTRRRRWHHGFVPVLALLVIPVTAVSQDAPPDDAYPFAPSRQTTPDGAPLAADAYVSNDECMACHVEIGRQWKGSMHAFAFEDPVFLALTAEAHELTGGATDRLCVGCHAPPAILSGKSTAEEARAMGRPTTDGVSCVVCHSIDRSNMPTGSHEPGNSSFVSDPAGPIRGSTGRTCGAVGKATVRSELHTRSEFCANCHGVVNPRNGFAVERTYEEWRGSLFAAKGFQCQDCHMQPVERVIESVQAMEPVRNPGRVAGVEREHVYTHGFTGGSSVMASLFGADEHARESEALLKASASLELQLPATAAAGEVVRFRVKVNNELAGHNLPTSLVVMRQMWLDIRVTDEDGALLYRSGALDQQGDIDPEAVMFRAVMGDAEGKPTTRPWEMASRLYEHTVPPLGFTLERFAFATPVEATGAITVAATLRYRSFPQKLVNRLLGDEAPEVEPVDMTSIVGTVELRP